MKIVSNPEDVCFDHALEFWTGLLGYVREHKGSCVTHDPVCTCQWCEELAASYLRAAAMATEEENTERCSQVTTAIGAAGPPPPAEQELFSILLAS
jgi:hypothetical protein